jgi:hypothetical protein
MLQGFASVYIGPTLQADLTSCSLATAGSIRTWLFLARACLSEGKATEQQRALLERQTVRNAERDAAAVAELERLGWEVAILWECSLAADTADLTAHLTAKRVGLQRANQISGEELRQLRGNRIPDHARDLLNAVSWVEDIIIGK